MTYLQIWELYALPLARGMALTIELSVVGVMAALPFGLFLAALRISTVTLARRGATALVDVVRGTPELLQLFLIYFGLVQIGIRFNSFVAVAVWLAIVGSSYSSEIFRAGIESVDAGQVEAARALGLGRVAAYRHVILPQAVLSVLPPLGNFLISTIKLTALSFTIGLSEVMGEAAKGASATYHSLPLYLLAAAYYFFVCWPLSLGVRRLEGVTKRFR
jgi:His/Glu/Gln/Arg/opine family amino acid ABC transporter permease subunit